MKITNIIPKTQFVNLKKVADYSVVRYKGNLYFKSTSEWLTLAMSPFGEPGIFDSDALVEVLIDAELVVKS